MMEWLNNANVIAGLIVALFGIGGYIFAITTYLKGKATKSLQDNKSPVQTSSARYANTDNMTFDRIDWVNAFAKGFFYFSIGEVDDSDTAFPLPIGCFATPIVAGIACVMIGGVFFIIFNFLFNWSSDSALKGAFVVGFICWLTILLGTYIHFVGKAVEAIGNKKRKQAVQPTIYRRK